MMWTPQFAFPTSFRTAAVEQSSCRLYAESDLNCTCRLRPCRAAPRRALKHLCSVARTSELVWHRGETAVCSEICFWGEHRIFDTKSGGTWRHYWALELISYSFRRISFGSEMEFSWKHPHTRAHTHTHTHTHIYIYTESAKKCIHTLTKENSTLYNRLL